MGDKLNEKNRAIILIPYAEINGYMSGVNVADQRNRREIYMKNCCVACLSARYKNDDSVDVALVTNIEIPKRFKVMLQKNDIMIFEEPFDLFQFDQNYTWSLAFYKLCALYKIVRKYHYQNYAYLDSDVFVQDSFDNIWLECEDHIMLYDINHGLQVEHYRHFLNEVKDFKDNLGKIVHYGGEFFAANREDTFDFSEKCLEIFNDMKEKGVITTHGDEFILSIAAIYFGNKVKNAGAYIYRFWTREFRLVSTCYINNRVTVLHVPDEKEYGMIRLFDIYQSGRNVECCTAHRMLHLKKRSLKMELALLKVKFIKRSR